MKSITIKMPPELKAKLDKFKKHPRQATYEIIQQLLDKERGSDVRRFGGL